MAGLTSRLPIGTDDFRKLRRQRALYVDKSGFIADVVRSNAEVLLFTRPRRFGKSLNLSMLGYFLEQGEEDLTELFADLAVWQDADVRAELQAHPVIRLTLKDVKAESFDLCLQGLQRVLKREFQRHEPSLAQHLTPTEKRDFSRITDGTAGQAELEGALSFLSALVARAHHRLVFLLLDEYDTPVHAAYVNGYYDRAIIFFRNFFSEAFKGNPHLAKGVLTGILRIAQESVFSGLNNLDVRTVLDQSFRTAFGFTRAEVDWLAARTGHEQHVAELESWYDGYDFGGAVMFNPWSVLKFLDRPEEGCRPYWVSTGDDALLRELLARGQFSVAPDLHSLMAGDGLERSLRDGIVMRDLECDPAAIWTLLLHLGYLRAEPARAAERTPSAVYHLRIPNREVRYNYAAMFRGSLDRSLGGESATAELIDALLAGAAEVAEERLGRILLTLLSYHDTAGPTPERVYHALVLGLLAHLEERFDVRSNVEAGRGRVDVVVAPLRAGEPGVVLELKSLRRSPVGRPESELARALAQIRDRDYAAPLRSKRAAPIHGLALVFHDKRVWVRAAPL